MGTESSNNFNGGDLILRPGQSGAGSTNPGRIVLGQIDEELDIVREDNTITGGTSTNIYGQTSTLGNGGDLTFTAGSGASTGGELEFRAGGGDVDGGGIRITAGNGNVAGGDIEILPGNGRFTGGSVNIRAGDANTNPGSVVLRAGTGTAGFGNVVIEYSENFRVLEGNVIIQNGDLVLSNGQTSEVRFTASSPSDGIIFYNNEKILTSRIDNVIFPPDECKITSLVDSTTQIESLTNSLQSLLNALGQCGHGLINLTDRSGNSGTCNNGVIGFNLPAPLPDISSGFDFYEFDYDPADPPVVTTEPDTSPSGNIQLDEIPRT